MKSSSAVVACWFACFVVGCSSSGGKSVTLSDAQLRAHPSVVAYLQARGTPDSTNRPLTIRNDGRTEAELSHYLEALRLEYATTQANLANAETIADESMKNRPYRRQFVEMSPNGEWQVRTDESPLPRRYSPTHPLADETGFVLLTNVDTTSEQLELRRISDDYEMVRGVLMRLKPNRAIEPINAPESAQASLPR
jgi:flagellar basal body rod protein FlgC